MKWNYASLVANWWVILGLLGGAIVFWETGLGKFFPAPISKSNLPSNFFVVGFNRSGKPVLLEREQSSYWLRRHSASYESRDEFRRVYERDRPHSILWREDERPGGPYSFYIDRHGLAAIRKAFQSRRFVTVLADDPRIRRQTVRVWTGGDRLQICIYTVDGNRVRALRYSRAGAMTLPFGALLGGAAMMLIWGICWIGLAIVKVFRSAIKSRGMGNV